MIQSSSGIASQSDAVLPWYAMPNIGRHPLAWHAAARSGKETVRANTILPGTEPGPRDFCPIHNPWGAGASPLTPSSPQ